MHGLFRRLRQSLIEEGRLRKYLVYAAGEIFLIVVGIMIALQINNLNENRKSEATLHASLSALESNLLEDIANMEEQIAFNHGVLEHIRFSFKVMAQPEYENRAFSAYADSLFNLAIERTFVVSKSAFQTMESGGHFQLIDAPTLTESIYKYYNFTDELLSLTRTNNQFVQLLLEPFIYRNFEIRVLSVLQGEYLNPEERPFRGGGESVVRGSLEFENLIISRRFRLQIENTRFQEGIEQANQLLLLLEEELK